MDATSGRRNRCASGDIKSVRHELGWFTGVVVVTHVSGYGAKKLAATLALSFGEPARHANQA